MDVSQVSSELAELLLSTTLRATALLVIAGSVGFLLLRDRPAWRGLVLTSVMVGLLIIPASGLLLPLIEVNVPEKPDVLALSAPVSVPPAIEASPELLPGPGPTGEGAARSQGLSWQTTIVSLYLIGLIVGLLRVGAGFLKTIDLRANTHCLEDSTTVDHWRENLGIVQKVDIGISDSVMTPTVMGLLRPLIVIPGHLYSRCDKETLDSIIVHELAHVKRGDLAVNWLGLIMSTLYWFHPLVHVVQWGIRKAREEVCDDWVVAVLGNARAYAETLLQVKGESRTELAAALRVDMARPRTVSKRVERIQERKVITDPRLRWFASPIAICIVGAGALLGCLAATAQSTQEEEYPRLFTIYGEDGGTGFIDASGKTVVEPRFQGAGFWAEGLCAIREDRKWGFIDVTGGKVVIEPIYESTGYVFSGGLCGVLIDGKWGFIDRTGVVAIPPQYEQVGRFTEGLAAVQEDGLWGFIDGKGTMVIKPRFEVGQQELEFRNGLAHVKETHGSEHYIDKRGKTIWSSSRTSDQVPYVLQKEVLGFIEAEVDGTSFYLVQLEIGLTGRNRDRYLTAGEISSLPIVEERIRKNKERLKSVISLELGSRATRHRPGEREKWEETWRAIGEALDTQVFSSLFSIEEDGIELSFHSFTRRNVSHSN